MIVDLWTCGSTRTLWLREWSCTNDLNIEAAMGVCYQQNQCAGDDQSLVLESGVKHTGRPEGFDAGIVAIGVALH